MAVTVVMMVVMMLVVVLVMSMVVIVTVFVGMSMRVWVGDIDGGCCRSGD